MDISALHIVTEDLASYLSEVTPGDLARRTPDGSGDLGDLYLHALGRNVAVAAAVSGGVVPRTRFDLPDRAELATSANLHGGGLETAYRDTAWILEDAFAAATGGHPTGEIEGYPGDLDVATLYATQIENTVLQTWATARALDLPYRPDVTVMQRMLRSLASRPVEAEAGRGSIGPDDAFACVLLLSGRAS